MPLGCCVPECHHCCLYVYQDDATKKKKLSFSTDVLNKNKKRAMYFKNQLLKSLFNDV